jgi:hypothetical protein
MVWLTCVHEDDESAAIRVEKLNQANVDETTTNLAFENYCFDEDSIVQAVIDLLHRAFQKGCQLGYLSIYDCTGRVDAILNAATSLDMFDKISLVGDSDGLSHYGFWSISVAIKFNKHLSKLGLTDMEMTRQQAAALAAGLITSNGQSHFKELRMSDMFVEEGAITELAFGLKHNFSLCILSVERCHLGDAELAELVEAVESHPSLKELSLQGNGGQKHALAALGKVLASTSCRLEELDFSGQGIRDEDGELSITELASGLKQNSTLCILNVERCHLGDAKLAELVDAVESHPSLKQLSLWGKGGQKHTLVALGKLLASSKCQLEELDFSDQGIDDDAHARTSLVRDHDGLTGHLGILAEGLRCNQSLTRLDLLWNGLLDKDMDVLGQILATCKLEQLNLSANRITHSGFVSFTKNLPKSLKWFDFSGNDFNQEEAACYTLELFEEYPQLWYDGWDWEDSESPIHQKIQHFKDLNRCGRILLVASDGAIPLSIWPTVLARANTLLSDNKERTNNAIFHLLQGPALMQRRFDRDYSQSTCVGASDRLTKSSKRGPAETIDQASAKKERSE